MTEPTPSASFEDFYRTYCDEETPVRVQIDDTEAEASNVFLYGQLADDKRILIVRSGLSKGRVFHWMATFDPTGGEEVTYEPITEVTSGHETADHRIAAVYGMNAAVMAIEDVKARDGRHTASLYLSSHTLRWHDELGEQPVITPPPADPTLS